jgi:hypothetical protein
MDATGRLFLCARCRVQVIICRRCDRGQRYCRDCAKEARRTSGREAGRRYQQTRQGRFAHAERARRHRARRKNVTHQGSLAPVFNAVLLLQRIGSSPPAMQPRHDSMPAPFLCHCCVQALPPFVRTGPLRRRGSQHVGRGDSS